MIDGEMHGDAALVESIRNDRMPDSPLKGAANILVMPNMEAARISYNLLRRLQFPKASRSARS
ncbi:NADP-dependent malate dehydrogenase [Salmonella enterica]|uniref:NADP-dependent malate dehydrogenase n=1 Tax=Salmonella sp. NCTC 6947 TaxID=2583581 RepID=A0A509BSX5_9ENTR|nr:NADP-dependent malate dehydrogenase [Salmonella enterica]